MARTLGVLLLDDDPEARSVVARVLAPRYSVTFIEPPRAEDFRRLLGGGFDLVITDSRARGIGCLEVVRLVKSKAPGRPVILFTKDAPAAQVVEAFSEGLDGWVTWDREDLLPLAVERSLLKENRFEEAPIGLYRATPSGEIVDANLTLARLLGVRARADLVGRTLPEFYSDAAERQQREPLAQRGELAGFEARVKRTDGEVFWAEENCHKSLSDSLYEGSLEDITPRKRAEEAHLRLQKAVDRLPIGITIADTAGRIVYTNPAEAETHGYTVRELLGREARILVPAEFRQAPAPEEMGPPAGGELKPWKRERVNVRKDGTTFPAQLISDVITAPTGEALGYVTTSEDITERKRNEEQLERNAFYDTLTGLANRALFMDRLGRALERSRRRRDYLFAVFFLDLDGFKTVNDTFGHLVGDHVLVEAARRLEASCRPSDTVSRFGGDEFALLAEDLSDAVDATQIAERTQRALATSVVLKGQELFITASIGIALGESHHERAEEVLRDADTAMYRAKALGKARFVAFDLNMHSEAKDTQEMESALRNGLERGEFYLEYQPVFDLATRLAVGRESLVRWEHPLKGALLPPQFVPLAEETGLMEPLGAWILERACTEALSWRGLSVSVNLSSREFHQPDLVMRVREVLARVGLHPALLELEITEEILMKDPLAGGRTLELLRSLGVKVVIDNFGTGYSSLTHLKRFQVDALKIDASFVHKVTLDPGDAAVATAIIALAHALGLLVVAEGVETEDQLTFLRERGCDRAQGRLLGWPKSEL